MYDFIETQLALWNEARERYLNLGKTKRRRFKIGDFEGFFQYNPARISSTAAVVDKESIKKRSCFLCKSNRPQEQIAVPLLDRWELLLNPFPIFPVHFTIASTTHIPQKSPTLDILSMADLYPEMAIFFNGAKAGASAPDHLHLQAVLKSELPLLKLTERYHLSKDTEIKSSTSFSLDLPFLYWSAVISPFEKDSQVILEVLRLTGEDEYGTPDTGLRNVIFWKDDSGFMRAIVIPRKAHRPSVYGDKENQFLVSPGTIDMAGIVVLPKEKDFEHITDEDMRKIFSDVAFSAIR